MSRRTCPECGQFAGGHFAGCPEDTDEENCANCGAEPTRRTEDGIWLCEKCYELCPSEDDA